MATISVAPEMVRRAVADLPPTESNGEAPDVPVVDLDPALVAEWQESFDDLLRHQGPEAVRELLTMLYSRAQSQAVPIVPSITTPYTNTLSTENQPEYPGDQEIERRLRSMVRWNAMAMVQQAYHSGSGVGGHIATFASSAALVETAQNHFFHAPTKDHTGDMVYFQGHASPGMYSRAFLEGRLT